MKNKFKWTMALTATATLASMQMNAKADETQNDSKTNINTEQTTSTQTIAEKNNQVVATKQAAVDTAVKAQQNAQIATTEQTQRATGDTSQKSTEDNETTSEKDTTTTTAATDNQKDATAVVTDEKDQNAANTVANTQNNTTKPAVTSENKPTSLVKETDSKESTATAVADVADNTTKQATTNLVAQTTPKQQVVSQQSNSQPAQTTTTAQNNKETANVTQQKTIDTPVTKVATSEVKPVAPADGDNEITELITSEAQLPQKLVEPKNLANGTESRGGVYYGWYDVDPDYDKSAKLQVSNGRLIDAQQKELADYAATLINNLRKEHNLAPYIVTEKLRKQVSSTELAYREKHPQTVDNHTSFIDLGKNGASYNPTHLYAPISSQNLGFGSATTLLEAKIDILNAFTAMAYKDADSDNGHLAEMLMTWDANQQGVVIPFVDYVADRGGAFSWDYLTDFVIFENRDLDTMAPVSKDTFNKELGLPVTDANTNSETTETNNTKSADNRTSNPNPAKPADKTSQKHPTTNTGTTVKQMTPVKQNLTTTTISKQTDETASVTSTKLANAGTQPATSFKATQLPNSKATKTINNKHVVANLTQTNKPLGSKQSAVTSAVQLQHAKEHAATAQAELKLAQAQLDATTNTSGSAAQSNSNIVVANQKHATTQTTKKALPNTGTADTPTATLTGLGLLLSTLGFGISRKRRQ